MDTIIKNLDVIYFFYGLAFLILGITLFQQFRVTKKSEFRLLNILWLLAWFGITHGIKEFIYMFILIKGELPFLEVFDSLFFFISYIFLFFFGYQLINTDKTNRVSTWFLYVNGFLFFAFPILLGAMSYYLWIISARYFLGFVGATLCAVGFYLYYHSEYEKLSKIPVKKYFNTAAFFFAAYGILGGLVIPKVDFFPASVINTESFISLIGLPVQIFRAVCAVGILWSMRHIVNIFNVEEAAERMRMEEALVRARDGLEIKVHERTADLEKTNKALLDENCERKRAEEALREERDKAQKYLDVAGVMLVVIDANQKVALINKKGCEILGYEEDEIEGRNWFDAFIPKRIRNEVKEAFESLMAGYVEPVKYFENPILTKSGEEKIIAWNNTILKDDKGKIIATLSSGEDITDRKRLEEIDRENDRLLHVSRAKSEFLANMSHELRTPLNSILGFSELLKEKNFGELNEKQRRFVENILTSTKFLLDLINDILDLSKVEAGKTELVLETISVPVAIDETIILIKERAAKHNLEVKKEFDTQLGFIEADRLRFKQVLFNLLSNAIKFSKKEGGTITITAKKVENMAQISVSDTGIGIKGEDMKKLFIEFEQANPGISQEYGGTGLGLAISKKLVELHGGKIMAESKYGEGSTFTFLLPLVGKKASE